MFGKEEGWSTVWTILGLTIAVGGCASTAAFAERQGDRSDSEIVRVAAELGVDDVSTEDTRVLRVPIEVRAGDDAVFIPGCAVRVFVGPDLNDVDFTIDQARDVPYARVYVDSTDVNPDRVPDPDVIRDLGLNPADLTPGTIIVPPGSSTLQTVTVAADADALGGDELGLRLDSSPEALGRFTDCPGSIASTDTLFVEHYLLPGLFFEAQGLALIAAGAFLAAIILFTGR